MLNRISNIKDNFNREGMNLFLFLSGKSISLFGSAIYTFVLGLFLLRTTGSGLTFATNLVLYTLPMILINPFAGVLVDKFEKKKIIVGTDFLNGLFLVFIYILAGRIGLNEYLIYISTFIMTSLSVIFNIGIETAKPYLVSEEKLVNINSSARVIESLSYVIGPLLGGLVYALIDTRLFILINAISFLVAAVLEYFINYKFNKAKIAGEVELKSEGDDERFWVKLKEGYKYIKDNNQLQALIYIFVALNFLFNFTVIVPLPYLLNTIWKVDSSVYGIVQGGLPVGMIAGSLLVKVILKRVDYNKLLKRINYYSGIFVLLFALPSVIFLNTPKQIIILIYYVFLMFVSGLVMSWVDIPTNVLLQKMVPGNILGRVISVKFSIIKIIVPISLMLSGYLVNIIPVSLLILIGAIIFTGFNIIFFSSQIGKNFISRNYADIFDNTSKNVL